MAELERTIWINGEIVPWAHATVHVLSQSMQRGSLVFDFMSCHWLPSGPVVFGLREHVDRFIGSTRIAGMKLAIDRPALLHAIGETVRANPGAAFVKISAYYPTPSIDVLPRDSQVTIAIAAYRQEDIVPDYKHVHAPASLYVGKTRKMPPWVLSPQTKIAASYLYTQLCKVEAREHGFDDVLLLDEDECVAESSTHSFCWIQDGALYTAPLDTVLEGVTRRAVIALAQDEGLAVHEVRRPFSELEQWTEAFLTGTSILVWPVSRVGTRKFDAPGPLTAKLGARLRKLLAAEDPKFSPLWLQPV